MVRLPSPMPALDESAIPSQAMACTVMTPSGTIVAKGQAAPRRRDHVVGAYSIQITEVEPRGVLEAMVYADQPLIVLRTESSPALRLRIDHITGPPQQREFYCHLS